MHLFAFCQVHVRDEPGSLARNLVGHPMRCDRQFIFFKEAKLQQPKRMGSALKWGGTGVSLVVLQISHGGIKCSSLPVDRELRKGSKEKGT